jgi:hypothetical protein
MIDVKDDILYKEIWDKGVFKDIYYPSVYILYVIDKFSYDILLKKNFCKCHIVPSTII